MNVLFSLSWLSSKILSWNLSESWEFRTVQHFHSHWGADLTALSFRLHYGCSVISGISALTFFLINEVCILLENLVSSKKVCSVFCTHWVSCKHNLLCPLQHMHVHTRLPMVVIAKICLALRLIHFCEADSAGLELFCMFGSEGCRPAHF